VRVHDDDVFGADKDGGVAIDDGLRARVGEVDAVGCLLQIKQNFVSGLRCGAGPGGAVIGELEDGCAGESSTHERAHEVTA